MNVTGAFKIKQEAERAAMPEEAEWPPGWFEATGGVIDDPTFVRPAQGDFEVREPLV